MRWSRADLHLHTACSDGLHTPEQLAQHLVRSPLAVAAVTDHDAIAGALRVEEALAGNGPEIVIGSEVSRADGHVLGLFLSRDVPTGLSARETVAAIHDQGGLAVAAHPYSLAMGVRDLAGALPFDGVEILNGSPLMDLSNSRAASRLRGRAADVGGSDAHVAWAAGRVTPSSRARAQPTCARPSWPDRPCCRGLARTPSGPACAPGLADLAHGSQPGPTGRHGCTCSSA